MLQIMAVRRSASHRFDFTSLSDLGASLERLVVNEPLGARRLSISHMGPLLDLAISRNVDVKAIEFMMQLGYGRSDLLVLLLEPTEIDPKESVEDAMNKSPTLQELDLSLRFSSGGQRSLRHTIVVNVRPLRTRRMQNIVSGEHAKRRYNESDYDHVESVIKLLRPQVILTTQCATRSAENQTLQKLGCSIQTVGNLRFDVIDDHHVMIVNGFHPSVYLGEDYLDEYAQRHRLTDAERLTRKMLLRSSLLLASITAFSALLGSRIGGTGLASLQESLKHNKLVLKTVDRYADVETDHAAVMDSMARMTLLES